MKIGALRRWIVFGPQNNKPKATEKEPLGLLAEIKESDGMSMLISPDFLKVVVPLLGAVVAWLANEHRKRAWEEYKRKEDKYITLLSALKGFYTSADADNAKQLKQRFLDELAACWLYCPDEVIRKGYAFLSTVHTGQTKSNEEKEHAVGDFVLAIRRDLFGKHLFLINRTRLKPDDFKHLTLT